MFEHPYIKRQREEQEARAAAAAAASPFESPEATLAIALALAHREIVRLEAGSVLTEVEVKSLRTLYEVVERAKLMEMREWAMKNKRGGKP